MLIPITPIATPRIASIAVSRGDEVTPTANITNNRPMPAISKKNTTWNTEAILAPVTATSNMAHYNPLMMSPPPLLLVFTELVSPVLAGSVPAFGLCGNAFAKPQHTVKIPTIPVRNPIKAWNLFLACPIVTNPWYTIIAPTPANAKKIAE
jgi:hypothetical protein